MDVARLEWGGMKTSSLVDSQRVTRLTFYQTLRKVDSYQLIPSDVRRGQAFRCPDADFLRNPQMDYGFSRLRSELDVNMLWGTDSIWGWMGIIPTRVLSSENIDTALSRFLIERASITRCAKKWKWTLLQYGTSSIGSMTRL